MKREPEKHDRIDSVDDRLPVRWALILSVAIAAGVGVGFIGGVVAGLGAGLATVGVLHKVVGT